MPDTLESQVVVVDVDRTSLEPWPREQLAQLADTLFEQQAIAVFGW